METVRSLRERMQRMQDGVPRLPVAMTPELADLVQLRTGGSYQVDQLSLALALLAPPSQSGSWTAVVGVDDLGVEAAHESGLDLRRTILVPDPGEHWVEATAALVDAMPLVLLRPPERVDERTAGRLGARLRKRSSTLLVHGRWPGAEARLGVVASQWSGAGAGEGRLHARKVVVGCRRGTAPPRTTELWLPAGDVPLRSCEPAPAPYAEQTG